MKFRQQLFGARSKFYMINDKSNVSYGIDDCSLYTGRFAQKDEYRKKTMGLACICSREKQLLGNSTIENQHSWQTKPVHPQKHF